MEFWSDTRRDPYMQDISTTIQQNLIFSFTERNRWVYYGRGRQVGAKTPETDIQHVSQTIVLAGYIDPQ